MSFWHSGVRWWCKQILLLKLVQFASYVVIKILNDVYMYVHLHLNKFWFILLEVESLWMKLIAKRILQSITTVFGITKLFPVMSSCLRAFIRPFGDRRDLRLLHRILVLNFACFLRELCHSIVIFLLLYSIFLLLQFLMWPLCLHN